VTVKTAVVILGHGSRRQGAGDPLAGLVSAVKSDGGIEIVEHAFLQYVPPSLPDVVARCVDQGAERVVIVPFFVQPGAHVTKDIPAVVEQLRRKYPRVVFAVTDHVGGHPLMKRIVTDLVGNAK
jgi:sirohydrochlorin ferrochelatase